MIFAVAQQAAPRDGRVASLRYADEDAAARAARALALKHNRPFVVLSVTRVIHPPEADIGPDLFDI